MKKKIFLLAMLFLLNILFSSCRFTPKMIEYYAQKENYVTAIGTITHIAYNEDRTALYLGFSDLTPQFSDDTFKVVGDNFLIVQEKEIDKKIYIGKQVEFVSATKYFGDGYVMPIVAISVDGETLLTFDEGFENFQEWIKDQ